jgi:sphingomyelin phosphodiesterase
LLFNLIQDYDLITLNEAFFGFGNPVDHLIFAAKQNGFPFAFHSPIPSIFSKHFVDGGVLLISKFKLSNHHWFKYHKSNGIDSLSEKGILYSRVHFDEDFDIHLFSTHMQANYPKVMKKCIRTRVSQFDQLKKVIEKHAFDSMPVIVTGDFNVDSNKNNGEEYQYLLKHLKIEEYDLVDSMSNQYEPTFGVDEKYFTSKNDYQSKQRIDYVLLFLPKVVRKKKIESFSTHVVQFKNIFPPLTQLSDHFGLNVEFNLSFSYHQLSEGA